MELLLHLFAALLLDILAYDFFITMTPDGAASVVPICRLRASPPAHGREHGGAWQGARLLLSHRVSSAAHARTTASGMCWHTWWKTSKPAARGLWHVVCI